MNIHLSEMHYAGHAYTREWDGTLEVVAVYHFTNLEHQAAVTGTYLGPDMLVIQYAGMVQVISTAYFRNSLLSAWFTDNDYNV